MFYSKLLETAQNSPFKTPISTVQCEQSVGDVAVKSRNIMAFDTPEGGLYKLHFTFKFML